MHRALRHASIGFHVSWRWQASSGSGTPSSGRQRLWDDFIREFDSIKLHDKNGRTYSPKTNLRGSKGTVWLYLESRSGVPFFHGAYCRMDKNGCINNDHDIHIRAQRATERVALKRGWTCSTMNLTTGRQPTAVTLRTWQWLSLSGCSMFRQSLPKAEAVLATFPGGVRTRMTGRKPKTGLKW